MIASETRIYKDVFDLSKTLFDYTSKFEKSLRPTLARRIEDKVLDMADTIVRANMDIERRPEILMAFAVEYESLQFLVNLAVERKQISYRQHAHLSRMMEGIGRQATSWKKSADNKRKKSIGIPFSTEDG